MTAPEVGVRVSEYVLDGIIGAGSFGQVWKAHHHIWKDKLVAVKLPSNPDYVRALQREGVTIHGLNHPNIVRAIGLDPYADLPYLVMEYVDGKSLKELIDENPKGLSSRAVYRILSGILHGLDHAHGCGVIHRDIKPANILVAGVNAKTIDEVAIDDVKVTDFGLGKAGEVTTASVMQSCTLSSEDAGDISGTLAYMAPEQRDRGETDERSDLYSVGVVLYEMICGERPSGGDLPSHLREDVPSWVDELYSKLYTRRERRIASAQDALKLLEAASVPPVVGANTTVRAGAGRYSTPPPIRTSRPQKPVGQPCRSCNETIEPGDNYCIRCGTQANESPRRCAACGAYPEADDRFCTHCGRPLPASVG